MGASQEAMRWKKRNAPALKIPTGFMQIFLASAPDHNGPAGQVLRMATEQNDLWRRHQFCSAQHRKGSGQKTGSFSRHMCGPGRAGPRGQTEPGRGERGKMEPNGVGWGQAAGPTHWRNAGLLQEPDPAGAAERSLPLLPEAGTFPACPRAAALFDAASALRTRSARARMVLA